MEKANKSKIGRLPWKVRNKLNEMLRDGLCYADVLKWLDTHIKPPDKKITRSNLSDWRKTGYQAWREERKATEYLRGLAEQSYAVADATGGNPAGVAARLLTKHLLKVMAKMSVDGDENNELFAQFTKAVATLNVAEAENRKLDLQNQRLELKEEELRFTKAKFKTQCAQKFLKWLENQDLVSIAKSGATHEEKIAAILRHMDKEEADELEEAGA